MARAEKSPVRAWVALVTLGVLGLGLGAHASHPGGSHLTTVGPIDPSNGFPVWYRDANGVSTELCLEPRNPLCGFAPGDVPQPDAPLTVPGNFPHEAFWMLASAEMGTAGGGRARLTLALEAAFAQDEVIAGEQISFGRIRIRVDNLRPGATYRVTHPYGVNAFTVEAGENAERGINFTEDIGGPDFARALESRVGPFLTWAPLSSAPPGYLGNPDVPHVITGSPFGTNVFRIEGPGVGAPGSPFLCRPPSTDCIQTNLFSLMGKRATRAGVGVVRATYSRTAATGALVDVFAFSQPGQTLHLRGPGVRTTPLAGNTAGQYSARLGMESAAVPASVNVVNVSDEPDMVVSVKPVDLVSIGRAEYDTATRELCIAARSSDVVEPPVLTAEGWGPLTAGSLVVAGVSVAPPSVTVGSSRGGSATLSVTVVGPRSEPLPTRAVAGPDQSVQQGQSVVLEGTGSTGDVTGFSWRQTAGTPVTLSGATLATASFTAPGVAGALTFELTVSGPGGSSTDTVRVTVLRATAPVARAGPDQTVVQGRTVTLDGSASTGTASFQWRQTAGVDVVLTGAATARPTFTFPAQDTVLVFELTVSGPRGSARDTVRVSRVRDTLTPTLIEFRTGPQEWRVTGTATVVGPDNTVTLYVGSTPGGRVLGTAQVDALGNWSFRERDSTQPPDGTRTVSLQSSAGGQALAVPVRVRR